jgi:hypothetical protein
VHSRHVCLHSVRIAAIFVYIPVKVMTWSCDFVYIQRDWSARSCDYDVALSGRGRGHVSDVIQILQSDWSAKMTGYLLLSDLQRAKEKCKHGR